MHDMSSLLSGKNKKNISKCCLLKCLCMQRIKDIITPLSKQSLNPIKLKLPYQHLSHYGQILQTTCCSLLKFLPSMQSVRIRKQFTFLSKLPVHILN